MQIKMLVQLKAIVFSSPVGLAVLYEANVVFKLLQTGTGS